MQHCILCQSHKTALYYQDHNRRYCNCNTCGCVFIPHQALPGAMEEKERYLSHQNNIEDSGFQNFVSPIVRAIKANHSPKDKGLDFGAGTGPVVSKLLEDLNYKMALYDPFFHPSKAPLLNTYEFIVCCEVIEHLHHPLKEFELLKKLLKKNGVLYCMTDLLPKKEDFKNWYYKNDFTHVIFYTPKTLQWIQKKVGFKQLEIDNRLIKFY